MLASLAQKRASARLPTARFRSRPHTRTIRPSELGRGAGRPDRRTSTLKPAGGGAARSIPPTPRVSRAGSPAAIGAIGERSQTLVTSDVTGAGKGLTPFPRRGYSPSAPSKPSEQSGGRHGRRRAPLVAPDGSLGSSKCEQQLSHQSFSHNTDHAGRAHAHSRAGRRVRFRQTGTMRPSHFDHRRRGMLTRAPRRFQPHPRRPCRQTA